MLLFELRDKLHWIGLFKIQTTSLVKKKRSVKASFGVPLQLASFYQTQWNVWQANKLLGLSSALNQVF